MTEQLRLTVARARQLGQGSAHLDADPTYARIFMRRISPYLTYAVVRFTPLSADAVTFMAITAGVMGGLLTAFATLGTSLLAILLLQLAYLLDVADGEVARVRGTSGRRGTYLDLIGHFLQNRALYGGSTFALILVTDHAWWAIVIALLGVGFASPFGEQARNQVLGRTDATSPHGGAREAPSRHATSLGGRLYELYRRVAFMWTYPAAMNLFCLALAGDAVRFLGNPDAEPFVLPWFAGTFAVTLAAKQLVNAARQLSPAIWR